LKQNLFASLLINTFLENTYWIY